MGRLQRHGHGESRRARAVAVVETVYRQREIDCEVSIPSIDAFSFGVMWTFYLE